jgi:hypothetical protein
MFGLPLWSRWVLAVAAFSALGLLGYALSRGHDSTAPSASQQGTLEANRVGQIVVAQDQAPHGAPYRGSASARQALARAIAADVRARIAVHDLTGPLTAIRCTGAPHARRAPGHDALVCTVMSASLTYVFYGVVDRRARTLTWCKQDAVAEAGLVVALSPRCLS